MDMYHHILRQARWLVMARQEATDKDKAQP